MPGAGLFPFFPSSVEGPFRGVSYLQNRPRSTFCLTDNYFKLEDFAEKMYLAQLFVKMMFSLRGNFQWHSFLLPFIWQLVLFSRNEVCLSPDRWPINSRLFVDESSLNAPNKKPHHHSNGSLLLHLWPLSFVTAMKTTTHLTICMFFECASSYWILEFL